MKVLTRFIACIAISLFAFGSTANADISFDSIFDAAGATQPFAAFGGRTAAGSLTGDVGQIGEDYILSPGALALGATTELIDFTFVGGLSQDPMSTDTTFTGGNLIFSWFDTAGTLVNQATLDVGPNDGNFLFGPIALAPGFLIPTQGFFDNSIDGLAVSADGFNHTGQWFINTGAPPIVGSSPGDSTFGNGDHAFQFNTEVVPEPTAAGLMFLGLSGLVCLRRKS